jgi:hypothetical protein
MVNTSGFALPELFTWQRLSHSLPHLDTRLGRGTNSHRITAARLAARQYTEQCNSATHGSRLRLPFLSLSQSALGNRKVTSAGVLRRDDEWLF